jgi:hypothetical protein
LSWFNIFVSCGAASSSTEAEQQAGISRATPAHCAAHSRPHLFADILKAIIWLTPDERHFGAQFGDSFEHLWKGLCSRLVGPLPSPLSVCSLELLGPELSSSLVANVFARACLFMTVPNTQTAKTTPPLKKAASARNTLLDDLDFISYAPVMSVAAGGSAATGFGYSKVLIDLLMCLAERQTSLLPTAKTANALQQSWNCIAMFTIPSITTNPFSAAAAAANSAPVNVFNAIQAVAIPSTTSASGNSLIPDKSSPQLHAQTALLDSLLFMLEANIEPCHAFYRELQTNRVHVWDNSTDSNGVDNIGGTERKHYTQHFLDASTLQVMNCV